MKIKKQIQPRPFEGKTYSLYGSENSTDDFYNRLNRVTNELLSLYNHDSKLLTTVQLLSQHRRLIRKFLRKTSDESLESHILQVLCQEFSRYTINTDSHIKSLPLYKRFRGTLATNEQQYHLYMIEIELTNRLNIEHFKKTEIRLAFLPHCLRDLDSECQKVQRGIDCVCRACSKICNINAVSKLLRRHRIQPFIWMTANLKSLFRQHRKNGNSVGVLGIACIPELVRGMRMCQRAGVPVIGIPLDANRCARWWGEFYPNTVNIKELEKLLMISKSKLTSQA